MKATALCRGSLLWIQMLLTARDQHCCSAEGAHGRLLHIDPNRLQFFEFEQITFSCVGFGDITKWRVTRKLRGLDTECGTNMETFHGPCRIKGAFEMDSGEYWCDANGNMRSTSVKISATAGSVILVSPTLPVAEGEDVTLSCINKEKSQVVANFSKDGVHSWASQDGTMTIFNVSKSDEGLYKCRIVGAGESPESLLAVQGSNPPSHQSSDGVIVGTSVALVVLLLGLGFYVYLKYRATRVNAETEAREPDPVYVNTPWTDPSMARYDSVSTIRSFNQDPDCMEIPEACEPSDRKAVKLKLIRLRLVQETALTLLDDL